MHDMKKLKDEYNAEKNAAKAKNQKILNQKPQMGCMVCKAQIFQSKIAPEMSIFSANSNST